MCLNCHVVAIDVELNDLQAIKNTCARLGWQLRENQTTYKWFSQWVDDSPVPRHLFETQAEYDRVVAMTAENRKAYMAALLGKCTHAIQVPGASYEIGLIKRTDQYIPIWDWYDPSLRKVVGTNAAPLVQAYAAERTKLQAAQLGHQYTEQTLADGTIELQIHIPQWA